MNLFYDTISPSTAKLCEREMRRRAVDLLSKQSPFLPPTKLLDRSLAEELVANLSVKDLSDAMSLDEEEWA